MDVEIAIRFPPDIFHVEFQFPFSFTGADRPDCNGCGIYLGKHEVGGRTGSIRPIDYQRSIQWQHSLGTIDQADRGDRFAIVVSQRGIQQAEVCAGPCSFAVEFDSSPAGAHLSQHNMPLPKKAGEGIDVCTYPDGQLIIQLVSYGWLDIEEWTRGRSDGRVERPIHRIASVQAKRRGETESDRHIR